MKDIVAESPFRPTPETALRDFEICCISRETSLLARKEVLTGKAKFGITGDGKEVPQVALARVFQQGDFRAGYYRDQTLLLALGLCSVEDLFAQLYADPENDPFSGGRQMNSHFATPLLDETGQWIEHTAQVNVSADLSSTAGQMARALGLALASKQYRSNELLKNKGHAFSNKGNEVVFCTIGDASTSEGVFWETINAAGVMQVPLAVLVWDDGYGISVPIEFQTSKGSISTALSGFQREDESGLDIYTAKGWDYAAMLSLFGEAVHKIRTEHAPALFHIQELTQPQGHSTSGSHERYKSKERLQWEKEQDCIVVMEQWLISSGFATAEQTEAIRQKARVYVKDCRERAWKAFNEPTFRKLNELKSIYQSIPDTLEGVAELRKELQQLPHPLISEITQNARRMSFCLLNTELPERGQLANWLQQMGQKAHDHYHSYLYSQSAKSALQVIPVAATYAPDAPLKNGFELLNAYFDYALEAYPELYAFGEDVGNIGDVNQGFAGLQKKYGEHRVFDTGIREWTIMGQAIGMAMRGLRPIAEIQYLDYLIYGLQPLTDDLSTLRYRSKGKQQAPAIIRTRGHRLEGIWHAGSPMGMIIHALRGMYVLVPRNMTQAVGFYNTMLQSDDPALIIECLNGYRLKEKFPSNIGEYTVPLGIPEVLTQGTDLSLVTYGSCVRVAQAALELLAGTGISVELIDVQSLLPFDIEGKILASIQKTGRVIFLDEDVPGGATSYMMREVLEVQGGFRWLDSAPVTLTAKAHRPPYGSDGDYFSKPNAEDVFEAVYQMVYEAEPSRFGSGLQ